MYRFNLPSANSCHQNMHLEKDRSRVDLSQLRYVSCGIRQSVRHGHPLFSKHFRIPLPTLFHIVRSLYESRQQKYIAAETQLDPSTIQEIHADYSELWRLHNDSHPIIFPSNDVVEIDEKKLRWHLGFYDPDPNAMIVEGEWVLGLVGRESKKVYMVSVIGRSEDDLIPTIERRVEKGATIITDKLSTYNILNAKGYTYRFIKKNDKKNKKISFARDDIGLGLRIHVNTIEGQWQKIEDELIHHHSVYGNRVACLLHEYMFKRNRGDFLDLLKYQ
jgi:hypothetical protein